MKLKGVPSEARLNGEVRDTRSGQGLSTKKCTFFSGEGSPTVCSGRRRAKRTEAAEHKGAEEAEGACMTESLEVGSARSGGA